MCFEVELRVGPTASMKMGTWLSRCTEFKQKDVTCHFHQRVASMSLALGLRPVVHRYSDTVVVSIFQQTVLAVAWNQGPQS